MHEGLPKEIVESASQTGQAELTPKKVQAARVLLDAARSPPSSDRQMNAMMKRFAMLFLALACLPATALAQSTRSPAPPYCFDLSRVVDLAVTKERFTSIAGRPRP